MRGVEVLNTSKGFLCPYGNNSCGEEFILASRVPMNYLSVLGRVMTTVVPRIGALFILIVPLISLMIP